MYYDDEDDDENYVSVDSDESDENNLVIADILWGPNPDNVDWQDANFASEIVSRLKGVTEEGFQKEVESWRLNISILPHFDEVEMRREISNWDISVPSKHEFDFGNFAISYSKQVQYRNRITEMISVVYAHHEILFQAHKNLKEMAIKLTSGAKHDKEATAAFAVHRFVAPMSHAKRFLTYLEHVLRNIDFAASQMDRMLREHQALSRINQVYNTEGMSQFYSRDTPTNSQYNKPSAKIKTRNSRID